MANEKKEYVAPKYSVVKFDSNILNQSPEVCMEAYSWQSGTDCKSQVMRLPME